MASKAMLPFQLFSDKGCLWFEEGGCRHRFSLKGVNWFGCGEPAQSVCQVSMHTKLCLCVAAGDGCLKCLHTATQLCLPVPAETSTFCVHGLWQRSLRSFVDFLAGERFNALRIPVSAELALSLDATQPNGISFEANPELEVMHLGTYSGPCFA